MNIKTVCRTLFFLTLVNAIPSSFAMQNEDAVDRLLMADVDVNVRDSDGKTLLMLAANNGRSEVAARLLQVPDIDVNARTNINGMTALLFAVMRGHHEVMERLLQATNIDANVQNNLGRTALMMAAALGHRQIVERLLQVPGVDVNAQDNDGQTALMLAVVGDQTAIAERLLQVPGINENKWNNNAMTALMIAASTGKPAAVRIILASDKIQVGLKNNLEKINRAYDEACMLSYWNTGRKECIALLSDTLSKINTLDRDLRHAARDGQTAEVSRLLLAGADVNAESLWQHDTALDYAIENGHIEIVRQLINAQNDLGETALKVRPSTLHTADLYNRIEIARLILAMPNIDITTIAPDATAFNCPEIKELIRAKARLAQPVLLRLCGSD
jgi:ankyrin repeat protein